MTREEAIRVLEYNRPSVIFEDEDAQKRMAELCKAIDMAIEALKENEVKRMNIDWYECINNGVIIGLLIAVLWRMP